VARSAVAAAVEFDGLPRRRDRRRLLRACDLGHHELTGVLTTWNILPKARYPSPMKHVSTCTHQRPFTAPARSRPAATGESALESG